jgi:hypothetical protein
MSNDDEACPYWGIKLKSPLKYEVLRGIVNEVLKNGEYYYVPNFLKQAITIQKMAVICNI